MLFRGSSTKIFSLIEEKAKKTPELIPEGRE
jgi:hypothetical protein